MTTARSRVIRAAFPAVFLCLSSVGCGSSGGGATVEGVVKVDGQPANGGMVVVTGDGGKSASGAITKDGTYTVTGAPTGAVKVVVNRDVMTAMPGTQPNAGAAKLASGMPGGTREPAVPIPAKYGQADTSGLSTTVNSGSNKYDIDLTSR